MANPQRRVRVVRGREEFMAAEMIPNVDLCYLPGVKQVNESENDNIPATAMFFYKKPESSQEEPESSQEDSESSEEEPESSQEEPESSQEEPESIAESNNPSAEGEKKSGGSGSEDSTKAVVKSQRHASACKCNSCSDLQEITDCGICCNPLQGRNVSNCTHCNNVMCTACTKGMVDCAFCRKEKSVVPNPGLERFLSFLTLPCRNACFGCPEWLTGRTRSTHEISCIYKGITCPVNEKECSWTGTSSQVLKHLKEAHDITPMSTQRIAFQVADLQYQCGGNVGESTIYLHIDDQLFTIKLAYFGRKLTLSFNRLGYVRTVNESAGNTRYGIWLKMNKVCVEDPQVKTAFATIRSSPRIFEIPTNLFPGADESLEEPIDFYLVMDITLKKFRRR